MKRRKMRIITTHVENKKQGMFYVIQCTTKKKLLEKNKNWPTNMHLVTNILNPELKRGRDFSFQEVVFLKVVVVLLHLDQLYTLQQL
jgi:hypothetical protein